jgi:hypothetical protein
LLQQPLLHQVGLIHADGKLPQLMLGCAVDFDLAALQLKVKFGRLFNAHPCTPAHSVTVGWHQASGRISIAQPVAGPSASHRRTHRSE